RANAEPVVIEKPVVVEKIVYVEKPATPAPAKKPRAAHLRAVPGVMSLPFFDEPAAEQARPSRDFPVLDTAPEPEAQAEPPVAIVAMIETLREEFLAGEERQRLEELLDELTGLKDRLKVARERARRI